MNFFGFPLYSTLFKELENKESVNIKIEDCKKFILKNFKKVTDRQDTEYLYALIVSYYIDHNNKNCDQVPYSGKVVKKDIKINVDDMPEKLLLIIYKFIKKYLETKVDIHTEPVASATVKTTKSNDPSTKKPLVKRVKKQIKLDNM